MPAFLTFQTFLSPNPKKLIQNVSQQLHICTQHKHSIDKLYRQKQLKGCGSTKFFFYLN